MPFGLSTAHLDSRTVYVDSHRRQYNSCGVYSKYSRHSLIFYFLFVQIKSLALLQVVLSEKHVTGNHNMIANAISRCRFPVNAYIMGVKFDRFHAILVTLILIAPDRTVCHQFDLIFPSCNSRLENWDNRCYDVLYERDVQFHLPTV